MERPAPVSSDPVAATEAFTLEELLAVAGAQLGEEISSRTVRLYATQGLVDRPGRDGRSAVYGRRQLLQLVLIRALARRGLSLAAIAPLSGLSDAELEQQLSQLGGDGCSSSSLLASIAADNQTTPTATAPDNLDRDAALDYLRSLSPSVSPQPPSLLPLLGAPLSRRASSRSGGSREAASRWHRFTLAPGVELQINESVAIPSAGPRRMAWLNRLLTRLLELLEDGPP